MGVSGQRHAPAALLPPGKGSSVPIVQEAGWTPEPVWTQRIEEKSFASAGIRSSSSSNSSMSFHPSERHRAFMKAHRFLFLLRAFISGQLFLWCSASILTVLRHVILGLPLPLPHCSASICASMSASHIVRTFQTILLLPAYFHIGFFELTN
jgi:hypothetical protein